MNVTEEKINLWAQPISETEEEKCANAIRLVSEAMRDRFGLGVTIIHQGSHKNRTNIRADSDVDIAVVYDDSFFSDVEALAPVHQQIHWDAIIPGTYPFADFKRDVHAALLTKFGLSSATRKNKCIRVEGNTYRVYADVVPAFKSKRYRSLGIVAYEGIGFIPDNLAPVQHSFPDQHYNSGVQKNEATSNAYKAVVRILKNTRNEMEGKNIILKDSMPSFFLECLVWNAPNSCFQNRTYREDARSVALTVWSHMRQSESSRTYKEVSELKWLFSGTHRTPLQAETFMLKAWSYLE